MRPQEFRPISRTFSRNLARSESSIRWSESRPVRPTWLTGSSKSFCDRHKATQFDPPHPCSSDAYSITGFDVTGLWFLVIFEWSVAISPSCDIVSRGVQTPRYVALLLHLHSDFLPVQRDDEARCQNCTQPFCTVTFFLFRSTKLYTTILRRNPFLFRSIFNVLKITGSYMMETKIFLSQVFMN